MKKLLYTIGAIIILILLGVLVTAELNTGVLQSSNFSDGATSKDISLVQSTPQTVYIRLAKFSNVTTATFDLEGPTASYDHSPVTTSYLGTGSTSWYINYYNKPANANTSVGHLFQIKYTNYTHTIFQNYTIHSSCLEDPNHLNQLQTTLSNGKASSKYHVTVHCENTWVSPGYAILNSIGNVGEYNHTGSGNLSYLIMQDDNWDTGVYWSDGTNKLRNGSLLTQWNTVYDFAIWWNITDPYPENITIDVGSDGVIDYINTSQIVGEVGTIDLNVTAINNYLMTCTADSNGDCLLPINITSRNSNGTLIVDAINITSTQYNSTMVFNDSGTGGALNPACTIDGTAITWSNWQDFGINHQVALSCYLFGYNLYTESFWQNDTGISDTKLMVPVYLQMIFDGVVEGYIATETTGLYFNTSNLTINMANISNVSGYVTVYFNPDGAGNWLQAYQFYNDGNTSVIENILTSDTPDLHQQVRVYGEGSALEYAWVCAKKLVKGSGTNVSTWYTAFCDYTDDTGTADLMVNDENEYLITVQADGYGSVSQLEYIPTSSAKIIIVELVPTVGSSGTTLIQTNYQPVFFDNTTVSFLLDTYTDATIVFEDNSSGTPVNTTFSSTSQAQYTVDMTSGSSTTELNIFLNGALVKSFLMMWGEENASINVDWFDQNLTNNQTSIYDHARSSKEYWVLLLVLVFIAAVFAGMLVEKYFSGYGLYGIAGFLFVIASTGFWELYLIALPVFLYAIFMLLRPLFGGSED